MGRGIYLGVEGLEPTCQINQHGGLIVCTIGRKITTLEIRGGARAP